MTKQLEIALRKGREALTFQADSQRLIERTHAEIAETQQQIVECRRALAIEEADLALGRPGLASNASASIKKLEEKITKLQARIEGLQQAQGNSGSQIIDAQRELSAALGKDTEERLQAFQDEFSRAAAQFAAVLTKGKTLGDALGIPAGGIEQTKIFMPFDMSKLAVSIEKPVLRPGSSKFEYVPVRSKFDERLFEEVNAQREVARGLQKEVFRIQEERHKCDQSRLITSLTERERTSVLKPRTIATAYVGSNPPAA